MSDSAWESMSSFVMTLAHGGGDVYDGWIENPKSAMISCNDGFRPVSFYIEAQDEDADETQNGAERTGSQRHINLRRYKQRKGFSPGSGCDRIWEENGRIHHESRIFCFFGHTAAVDGAVSWWQKS